MTRPQDHSPDRSPPTPFVSETQRWERQDLDPVHRLRIAIGAVRAAPDDPEARAALGAMVDKRELRDALAILLSDEARAADRPAVAAALFEHLVDVHEELDQPLDAITAMEAAVANAPDIAELHDRLAWMYRKAGAWAKAAAAFVAVGELDPDERGRAALRAAGRLYRDHGQLARAAEVFRAIVARRPGDEQAWRELDDVLSELGRWREVAEVRATRAERARGIERAALLRSQARAHEQAGELEAAASAVAQAATHAPEDLSGMIDHADVLVRGGRHGEAAALLDARLAEAIQRAAPPDQIAAIRLRIVGALDDAGERTMAAALLRELLAHTPEYLPALERAAAFAATEDPAAHATALLHYAAALPEAEPAIVVAAARQFRVAADHEAAVRAYERALELGADHSVETELEDARASLIAERSRIAALAGDIEGALRRLRAVLASRFSKDAHLALADVLCSEHRLDEAAAHLRDTLNRTDAPPAVLAPLIHRHASVQQALGNHDDAHRLLHEAHRLDRRDLAITLALGESCFARRLWREAARHLGALAEHPDLQRHGKAVAVGLVHASLAETRSLRPGNAVAHLEAAVRIDPACAPAWHALAEAAIERGDLERAADCLEREATATLAPSDRVRLYDALGDMARDVLGDMARAERCWAQILDLADATVLDKLLALQRTRGATTERARTCVRLAELHAPARKQLLEEAATMFAAGGELARGRSIAEDLIAAHPGGLETLACATDVAAADPVLVARWLRRPLSSIDGRASTSSVERGAQMAALWRKLGDAERALGNLHDARVAYRKAAIAAPDSDHALAARRGLVELATDERSATAPVALESSLFALVEADPDPGDAISLARELRAANPIDARAMYELARVLGATLSEDDETFYASHALRALASDEGYACRLDDRQLIEADDQHPLEDICELLGEVAPLITSDTRIGLLEADLADAQRAAITGNAAAASMLPQIAKAFGGPTALLFTSTRAKSDIALILAAPPAIVLGPRLARVRVTSEHDSAHDAALRFELGRILELARWRRVFASGVAHEDLLAFVAALAALAPGGEATASPGAIRDAERLRGRLPLTHRKRLADKLESLPAGAFDGDAYLASCRRAADRAGLLACGDLVVAIDRVGGIAAAPHLIAMAVTHDYLAARRALRHRDTDERTSPFART